MTTDKETPIIGARRSGKTTQFKRMFTEYMKKNGYTEAEIKDKLRKL